MDAGIRKSVLVVDDNDANILILSALLKRMGFSVDEAKSGKDAIGLASGVKYDLVFMDHLMPGMDGAEAARQILLLSGGKGRPVIIGVSATIDEEVVEAFSGAGVHEILEKPVTMDRKSCALSVLLIQRGYSLLSGRKAVLAIFCPVSVDLITKRVWR